MKTHYIESAKIQKINTRSKSLLQSSKFLFYTSLLVVGVYIYQMINISLLSPEELKGSDFLNIHGQYWFEYLRQTIQSVGSLSILIGITLIGRQKKSFGPFNLIGNALILINGLITGLWFEAVVRATMFTLYAFQFANWDKRDEKGVEIGRANKFEWSGFFGITFIFLALAFIFIYVPIGDDKVIADLLGMDKKAAPFDAIQGGLNIVGVWLIARRKTEGQLALVISNMSALIMFMFVGQWVMVASTFAFMLVSVIAWIEWDTNYCVKTETNFIYLLKYKK